jgi:hypothetical protein
MDKELYLYAWVGEDELGSGEVGLKQGLTPAGMIPLVAVDESKMTQDYIQEGLHEQAKQFGKTIRLCRFKYDGEVVRLEP